MLLSLVYAIVTSYCHVSWPARNNFMSQDSEVPNDIFHDFLVLQVISHPQSLEPI